MQLLHGEADDGTREGVPAAGAPHEVRLVDDGHVDEAVNVRHLHRARHVSGVRHGLALLPRQQVALDAVLGVQVLRHLPGQQAQRAAVHAAGRLLQALQRAVRLAAVCGPHVQVDVACHAAGQRVPLPRVAHVHDAAHQLVGAEPAELRLHGGVGVELEALGVASSGGGGEALQRPRGFGGGDGGGDGLGGEPLQRVGRHPRGSTTTDLLGTLGGGGGDDGGSL
mmetsp:Transcript_15226/g.36871  ORF Transcript_15226/g.36871 Transcript_15226/m.36871 type:complete len:224 (-) Transcript_15226:67-738(-)